MHTHFVLSCINVRPEPLGPRFLIPSPADSFQSVVDESNRAPFDLKTSKHVRCGIKCRFPTNRRINKRQHKRCKLESPHSFDQALLHSNKCIHSHQKQITCGWTVHKLSWQMKPKMSLPWWRKKHSLSLNVSKRQNCPPKRIKWAKKTIICHMWRCVCMSVIVLCH